MENNKYKNIDLGYLPDKKDLILDLKIIPKVRKNSRKVINKFASKNNSKIISIQGDNIKSALQKTLSPENIFNSMGDFLNVNRKSMQFLSLKGISLPKKDLKNFPGPKYGVKGVKKILKRPGSFSCIELDKGEMSLREYGNEIKEKWVEGYDFVCETTNNYTDFERRVSIIIGAKKKVEKELKEKREFLFDISSKEDLIKNAKIVEKLGGKFVSIDVERVGWDSLRKLRKENFKLVILVKNAIKIERKKFPVSEEVLGKLLNYLGADIIEINLGSGEKDIKEIKKSLFDIFSREKPFKKSMILFSGNIDNKKSFYLEKIIGKGLIIQKK